MPAGLKIEELTDAVFIDQKICVLSAALLGFRFAIGNPCPPGSLEIGPEHPGRVAVFDRRQHSPRTHCSS